MKGTAATNDGTSVGNDRLVIELPSGRSYILTLEHLISLLMLHKKEHSMPISCETRKAT